MTPSARQQTLIIGTGSFLGAQLSKALLSQNCTVFAIGSSTLVTDLLPQKNFTLLEFDLTQPLPSYLPPFDHIFHLSPGHHPFDAQILNFAKSPNTQVALFYPAASQPFTRRSFSEGGPQATIFLVGDLYGPGMPLTPGSSFPDNALAHLIRQAITGDQLVLENEGLDNFLPAYIADVVFAASKLTFGAKPNGYIHYLVSEPPRTQLSAAYELQHVARAVLGKEINIAFSPSVPGNVHLQKPSLSLKTTDLEFIPKFGLAEGLRQTLTYSKEHGQVKEFRIKNQELRISEQLRPPSEASPPSTRHSGEPAKPETPESRFWTSSPRGEAGQNDNVGSSSRAKFTRKRVFWTSLAILLIFLASILFDLARGAASLKNAQASAYSGDLAQAQQNAAIAASSFSSGNSKVRLLSAPLAPILKNQVGQLRQLVDGLAAGSQAAADFLSAADSLSQTLASVTSPAGSPQLDLESSSASFKKAYRESAYASASLAPFTSPRITAAQEAFASLTRQASLAYDLNHLLPDFLGPTATKTYLVLLMNNSELRPGGGFIGNYALVEFDKGKLKNITVEDIYTIDGQLAEKITPPAPLAEKLGLDRLYLRDSNWSADWRQNASTARDLFKKETGRDVDGVFALDLTFMQNLLEKTGPIKLADYEEEITGDNLFERGQYYSEIGFFPGSTQKRDFFGALSRVLISRLIDDPSLPALFEVVQDGLTQKHLILTFQDPKLANFASQNNVSASLPPFSFNPADDKSGTRDFLAVVDANVGANKVNRFLERKISYEMTIGRDADLVAKTTITYTNNSQAETWPGGRYLNYLRLYTPFAASLFEYQNGGKNDLKEVEITSQGGLTVFAVYVEVPVNSTKQVSFTYRIPKNIKLESAPTYHLYIQKQPGTGPDPLEFRLNLPQYLAVKSAKGDFDTDLSSDREFIVEVEKK